MVWYRTRTKAPTKMSSTRLVTRDGCAGLLFIVLDTARLLRQKRLPLQNLIERLDKGRWPDLDPGILNAEAATLGPLNVAPPSFLRFESAPFLRPFDALDEHDCEREHHDSGGCNGEF